MSTRVTLERYAQIRAEMEAGVLRDEALARAGLTIEEWAEAQLAWLEKMGAELAQGRFDLAGRYGEAFVERQGAFAGAGARSAAPTTPPRVGEGPTSPARSSGATAPAQPAPAMPPLDPLSDATATVDLSRLGAALPSKAPALPFAAGRAVGPTAAASDAWKHAESPADTDDARETLPDATLGFAFPRRPALPFGPSASPALEARALDAAGPDARTADARAPDACETVTLSPAARKGPALPFTPSAAPAPDPSAAVGLDEAATMPFGVRAQPMPAIAAVSGGAAPPAAKAHAPLGPTSLTLERYASLCVDIARDPARAGEVMRRYGLTPEQAHAIDAYWKARVAAEPAVRAAFDRAHGAYRMWLAGAQGKPGKA